MIRRVIHNFHKVFNSLNTLRPKGFHNFHRVFNSPET